jgi:hypothetical protein
LVGLGIASDAARISDGSISLIAAEQTRQTQETEETPIIEAVIVRPSRGGLIGRGLRGHWRGEPGEQQQQDRPKKLSGALHDTPPGKMVCQQLQVVG